MNNKYIDDELEHALDCLQELENEAYYACLDRADFGGDSQLPKRVRDLAEIVRLGIKEMYRVAKESAVFEAERQRRIDESPNPFDDGYIESPGA